MATLVATSMNRTAAQTSTNPKRAGYWGSDGGAVWRGIDEGVNNTMKSIRVVQTVIAGTQLSGLSVPDEVLNDDGISIVEGHTKPYIEIAAGFTLSNGQAQDATGSAAIRLAKFAAKALALAEDGIFLLGEAAVLPPGVRVESGEGAFGKGLMGLAKARITVNPKDLTPIGEVVLEAFVKGITSLIANGQSGPFFLIAGTNAFIAISGTTINGIPTAQILAPTLLGGSISPSAAMPTDMVLMIATGGDPTMIYVDTDPVTEPTHQDSRGRYHFRTFERVQYVASDPDAFVVLDLSDVHVDPEASRKK